MLVFYYTKNENEDNQLQLWYFLIRNDDCKRNFAAGKICLFSFLSFGQAPKNSVFIIGSQIENNDGGIPSLQ